MSIATKRAETKAQIDKYAKPLTGEEIAILNQTAQLTIEQVQEGKLTPEQVVLAYIKESALLQPQINAITEPMFDEALEQAKSVKTSGPLAGFPISMKDTVRVKGFDSTVGYKTNIGKPSTTNAPLIEMLRDAGAVPFAKTNIPMTLLSFECTNDVFGSTDNPHVKGYCPGGSTGGESALLAAGGSRLGVGTDVAGSVRLPAHFAGCYSLKCSTTRWPKDGNSTSMPGQDGIPAVYSPMTRTLEDLSFFTRTFIGLKPWTYDYSCVNMPWRVYKAPSTLKVGVIWSDDVIEPSPACARALKASVDALKAKGHTIVDFKVPKSHDALRIASHLLVADGGALVTRNRQWFESDDIGVGRGLFYMRLPWVLRKLYTLFVRYVRRDTHWADLIENFKEQSVPEYWDLVAEREGYKSLFFKEFNKSGVDILLTVPNATPAFPHGGLYNSWSSCGYTFLFNLLDYSAGVMPVLKVDKALDALPKDFAPRSGIEAGAYLNYDAEKMHGLPVGVQVVGRRLEEEKVLGCMELLQDALAASGVVYEQLPIKQ